jgi:FSR family fosmidomycin resistance protein-like MFS transporter
MHSTLTTPTAPAPSPAGEVTHQPAPPAGPDRFRLGLLATGHAVTDSYGQSLLAPVFPELARRLGLSLAEVGGLPVMMGLSASLAQPLLGWLSDRRPRWCLVAWGPLAAALVIGFVGHAGSYAQLAALLFLAGIGIGAFHPQGATLARQAGRGSGLAMSAFTVGGNIGFGLAPLLGGLYVAWFGLERLYLAAGPAVLFSVVMFLSFRRAPPVPPLVLPEPPERKKPGAAGGHPAALAALTGTVVVRSAVQIGMATFLPFLVEQRFPTAQQEAMKATAVSAFLLASAASGPLGGLLSDRYGRRRLMMASFAIAPWPMLAGLTQHGWSLLVLLAAGAFLLMLPHPGNVVQAQELMPRSAGIAASLITGLAWGLAQLLAPAVGWLAEATSVSAALALLCLLPLLGTPLVLAIPERVGREPLPG